MRIGVYGGTFDPVHIGHLAVVESVREIAALDRVLFVPNSRQPLKEQGPVAGVEQRLRMLRAAIADNPAFAVSAIELGRPSPSYTIDTLTALRAAHPGAEIRFIMGADAADGLIDWREPARILAEFRPIVMSRPGWAGQSTHKGRPSWDTLERVLPGARGMVEAVEVPHLAISSSEIRARVAAGRSIRYLVPDAVRIIIEEEGLYR
jgi:nicotinate-nucleotide adenylyltransferase